MESYRYICPTQRRRTNLEIEGGDTSDKHYGLAVDVGTTTIVVQLVNLKTGKIIGVKGSHNLQARYGEDVISRMIFACVRGSLKPVHKAVITNINNLAHALAQENHINNRDIRTIVAAGNTTMSHFLLNLTPCSIRLEPYVPTTTVYPQIFAREVGIDINAEGILEVMPSIASYVGGDIVAGVLACGMAEKPEIRCLIDVGTNGEIVIGNNEWLVVVLLLPGQLSKAAAREVACVPRKAQSKKSRYAMARYPTKLSASKTEGYLWLRID